MAARKHKNRITETLSHHGRGLLTITDIESEYCDFYTNLFKRRSDQSFIPMNVHRSPISSEQSANLEPPFSEDEVHRVVFSLGVSKSLGPDGFTANLFKFFLITLKLVIMNMISDFHSNGIIKCFIK